jgi:Transposase DDE domain
MKPSHLLRLLTLSFMPMPFGGEATGSTPTDRGKGGTKRSVLTEGQGIPLAVVVAGANRHDMKLLADTLDAVVVERRSPRSKRRSICVWTRAMIMPSVAKSLSSMSTSHIFGPGEKNSGRSERSRATVHGAGWSKEATYNTPIQTTVSYPMISLTGLLPLVTVVDKFRPQAVEENGSGCRPSSSPPAHRAQRAHPGVDAAARAEPPTPPVAAQPAAGAPAKRCSRAGGGRR